MPETPLTEDNEKTLGLIVEALDAKQAEELRILDVRGISTITEFIIIANGTSNPHLRALRGAVEKALKDAGVYLIGADTAEGSGWLVLDAFDCMIHLFTREMRHNYRLEQLWNDARDIPPETWISAPTSSSVV